MLVPAPVLAYFASKAAIGPMLDIVVGANNHDVTHEVGIRSPLEVFVKIAEYSWILPIFAGLALALVAQRPRRGDAAKRDELRLVLFMLLAGLLAVWMQKKFYLLHGTGPPRPTHGHLRAGAPMGAGREAPIIAQGACCLPRRRGHPPLGEHVHGRRLRHVASWRGSRLEALPRPVDGAGVWRGLRRGYCDYYATAFVVLARVAGLPARFATGFAAGSWSAPDRQWVITEAEAHSWPEVYFPEVGWVAFEPTAAQPAPQRVGLPAAVSDATTASEFEPLAPEADATPTVAWVFMLVVLAAVGTLLLGAACMLAR